VIDNAGWVVGDGFGMSIPAHAGALRDGGIAFLTKAFHVSEVMQPDNRVIRIRHCQEVSGGSTGRKLLLSVEYEQPRPDLHSDLFVKFSRDFDDPVRDRGKTQMSSEVRFGSLSRTPGFPIAVPTTYFGDYHRETGTGILISERIRFETMESSASTPSAWTIGCPNRSTITEPS
jgi:hypothetical protein